MLLTAFGHSTVTMDHDGYRLVLDPGTLSDTAGAMTGASAILVTHGHPDHVDAATVRSAVLAGARVWAPAPVIEQLADELPAVAVAQLTVAAPGDVLTVDGFDVRVGGGTHAEIHRDLPRIPNVTYLVAADGRTVYHPGDAFDRPAGNGWSTEDGRLDVALIPVAGPWMKISDSIDLARELDPRRVVPIHEALLSPAGIALVDRLLDTVRTGGTYEYRRLANGQGIDL